MKNRIVQGKFIVITTILFIVFMNYIYSQDCSDGYTYFNELPETATIISGDSCLYNLDLDALTDLKEANGLVDDNTAIEVGNQTWSYGRLTVLVANYTPNGTNGVNTQLSTLPESFGNLSELALLYLEWNSLTSLPDSFSQLTNLFNITINNNWLTHLPEDIGNLSNLMNLDLGYNQLNSIPPSVCDIENLNYLYLFNNNLTSLPECMCELSIDWEGIDGGWSPYFACGGNHLCGNVPECIEESTYFESTLDQFYYSTILDAPQICVDYSLDIQPIFDASCTNCHGNAGGLNLSSYNHVMDGGNSAAVIVPGDHASSELYIRITLPSESDEDMPPQGSLSAYEIALIAQWIDEGALDSPESCGASVGDVNGDEVYNVLDIVTLANCVLGENCPDLEYGCAGDMNDDEFYNVLDIVTLANCVLAEDCDN